MLNGNKYLLHHPFTPSPKQKQGKNEHLFTSLEKGPSFPLWFFRRDRLKYHYQFDIQHIPFTHLYNYLGISQLGKKTSTIRQVH